MSRIEAETPSTVVAIISSNYLLRLGLQRIVETETWIRLVGQTAQGIDLDKIIASERPHIAILDTETDNAVPELIHKIKESVPGIKTILLSGFDDLECTRQAFASGVDGVVLKVQPAAVLIATITHLARPIADVMLTIDGAAPRPRLKIPTDPPLLSSTASARTRRPDDLTERECEVVRLISEGLSNKDIAHRLCISSITVRHHLTNIFDKLGVPNRQKLLIRAHRHGLVGSPASA